MTTRYYAKALNTRGKIVQLLVTKEPGKPGVPQWTGKTYRSDREADADLAVLNFSIARVSYHPETGYSGVPPIDLPRKSKTR